jgi:hypothetical protein
MGHWMFVVTVDLTEPDYLAFATWIKSQDLDVRAAILAEFGKMKAAGLSIESAQELINNQYETHVLFLEIARAYLLFARNILDNRIVSLGFSALFHGEQHAIDQVYSETCRHFAIKNPSRAPASDFW